MAKLGAGTVGAAKVVVARAVVAMGGGRRGWWRRRRRRRGKCTEDAQHAHEVSLLDVEEPRLGERQPEHAEHCLLLEGRQLVLEGGQLGEEVASGEEDTLLGDALLRLLER